MLAIVTDPQKCTLSNGYFAILMLATAKCLQKYTLSNEY
jgi:hypothetical protein